MTQIIRNRTIRPSTRLETSKTSKVSTQKASHGDTVIVNIDHESNPFRATYKFNGSDFAHKDSIWFTVRDDGRSINIMWSGPQPVSNEPNGLTSTNKAMPRKAATHTGTPTSKGIGVKTSFEPISDPATVALVLGTMPGEESLRMREYYRHSGNRFWKILSAITRSDYAKIYSEKKTLLLKSKIGVWDVAHTVIRKGSLDSEIESAQSNDLDSFISRHSKLKVVAFNGTKAEEIFDKYFCRKPNLIYLSLPSSSSANTGTTFEAVCKRWAQIIKYTGN